MAELKPPGSRRCNYFFLYDGSKVREEGDPTREGICYFYPEQTPLDKQELLCGQLAGVGRCVSELSSSPISTLRLRRSKFAIRMKDDFFWALGCSVDAPTVGVCEFLDQLINLFCFYHGSVRRSYQLNSKETLAAQWAYYLSHLQSGPSELYNTFSSLRTIDSTNVDPLLLLKAALILQACQRCPLVLAGCILFKGRLVSTQMPPELTMKLMVHESETCTQTAGIIYAPGCLKPSPGLHPRCATGRMCLHPGSWSLAYLLLKSNKYHHWIREGMEIRKRTPKTIRDKRQTARSVYAPCCLKQTPEQPLRRITPSCDASEDGHRKWSKNVKEAHRSNGPGTSSSSGGAVSSTNVFLTTSELQNLQSAPVEKDFSSHSTPVKDAPPKRTRLSRTLSDTPSTGSDSSNPSCSQYPQKLSLSPRFSESDNSVFSPALSQKAADSPNPFNGSISQERGDEALEESYYHSFHNSGGGGSQMQCEGDGSVFEEPPRLNGDGDTACGPVFDYRRADSGNEQAHDDEMVVGDSGVCSGSAKGHEAEMRPPPPLSCAFYSLEESQLIPMTLYMHRVNSLVLALLVEPPFMNDTVSMEEVYHSSLASLNGLEAHLRSISPGPPAAPGPYIFAHFDCIQSTLTTNVSGRPGGGPEHPFVRATSLLHSHFCNTETLQEAIIRNVSTAVYGTRSVAQETYFQQHGGSLRNSGIPNHQDSAFSLPSKARHRLLKHGVNLL